MLSCKGLPLIRRCTVKPWGSHGLPISPQSTPPTHRSMRPTKAPKIILKKVTISKQFDEWQRLVISEGIFVDTLYSIAIADIEALRTLEQGQKKELPSVLILCGKLLQCSMTRGFVSSLCCGRCTPKLLPWCIAPNVSVQRVEPCKFCQVLLSSRTQDAYRSCAKR